MMTKQDKKTEILEAGAEVMQTHGYHGTGIQQIVNAAGVPKGSFYNYFKSKEDFAISAMEYTSRKPLVSFQESLQNDALPPRQRVVSAFKNMADDFARENDFSKGCMVGNMCQEMADTHPAIAEKAEYLFRSYTAALATCLRAGQAAGEINDAYDPNKLAEFLFNSWEGSVMRMKSSRDAQPLNAFIDTLANVLTS